MDFLQQIDPNLIIWLTVGCGLLCVVGGVIFVVLQILGFGFEILFHVLEFFGQILAGGPIAWCGCFVFVFGCGACGLLTWALATALPNCGTAEALNICRLLG